ncbi:MAG: alpha/beta hydrolase [Streptosporangiales bacterium]|nr:alpha/beta hydrolase [Streptosporangiales bacterium]
MFASRTDQRFSYCLYVPHHRDGDPQRYPLIVIQHGTGRTAGQYRDAMADFCEAHRCVVLAPLFPAGIVDPDDLHNFKFIAYRDIRFDLVLLDMVDQVADRFPVDAGRFLLHGFSGGGQFTHRFLYLHPHRLAAASIGAPGRITELDDGKPWWLGTHGFADRFGAPPDLDAIRQVPVQLVVGAEDVETWEINNPSDTNWMDGVEQTGSTRIERLQTLRRNYEGHGIAVRFDLVDGVAHEGTLVLPTVSAFFADVLATTAPR